MTQDSKKRHFSGPLTTYEAFERSSEENRRLLRQEEFILQVAEEIVALLERERLSRAELATRLGKSRGFVSQLLAGDKNLTLRTLSDLCDAIGYRPEVKMNRDFAATRSLVQKLPVTRTQCVWLSIVRPEGNTEPENPDVEQGMGAA